MAIQVRRGNYADLDTSKLVQGEPFVTLDETPTGGYFVGMTIAPNNVVRLASYDDLTDVKTDCEQARDDAQQAASDAATSELNAATSESNSEAWAVGERGGVPVSSGDDTYENNSKYYAGEAGTYWGYVDAAINLVVPTITINWTTGQVEADGTSWWFNINQTTGQLEWAVSHV